MKDTQNPPVPFFEVLGVRVSAVTLRGAVELIERWAQDSVRRYVCVAPVATVMDCQDDPQYRQVVNGADLVTPDGMPLVWLGRWKGQTQIARTYGPDLMHALCAASEQKGLKHFFYGGSRQTNEQLISVLRRKFPGLNIVGQYAPRMLAVREREKSDIIAMINQSGADILWVGLGSPKQDFWMAMHREELTVPVLIGAGAAFDFLAGTKRQAPRWMQRSGFEWLFRLCCEPRRLWRRYLIGNARFVYLILTRELLRKSPGNITKS